MILEALVRHYDRLADDPESGIAAYGYSPQQISFCICLEPSGKLRSIQSLIHDIAGKSRPTILKVPYPGGKRTSGIKPYLLWDKAAYVLGRDPKEEHKYGAQRRSRLTQQFIAFRELHESFESRINHPAFTTVCNFLRSWDPDQAESLEFWADFGNANFVFEIRNENIYVHDIPEIKEIWEASLGSSGTAWCSTCLVSGQIAPIAQTHLPIKGIYDPGGQSEKSIASFNKTAFTSFGREQTYNAPVSEAAAFKYATALNRLLADREHCVQLGDTTCVFWTDRPETGAADALNDALGGGDWMSSTPSAADREVEAGQALSDFLNRFRQAKADPAASKLEHADAPFCILGLAPNAARISVRFWHQSTVSQVAKQLQAHVDRLQIVGLYENQSPSLWHLIRSTARESKEIKPNIAGELTRAFLYDRPFPRSFLNALLNRIRIEGEINPARAAGLKAYLLTHGIAPMDIYLNREHPSIAYHAGRILAILAFAQEKALGDINAGVVKKNFAAAMATPGLTLGRLQSAAERGHLHKLDASLADFVRDELTSANCRMLDGPPNNLGPDDQTLFALGFYQQTAYLRVVGGQVNKNTRHRSNLGEWMRSKLEVKVANLMNKVGFNYVYETSAMLPNAGERWPDFVIRGGEPKSDTYIEVAGYPGEEYDKRHQLKIKAYHDLKITEEGGENGRLIVLDYRDRDYDDRSVLDALRALTTPNTQDPSEED